MPSGFGREKKCVCVMCVDDWMESSVRFARAMDTSHRYLPPLILAMKRTFYSVHSIHIESQGGEGKATK